MPDYYTIDGEKVEAYSPEEVEEKVEEAKEEAVEEVEGKYEDAVPAEEIEEKYVEKDEYEQLSDRHEQLKGQYDSAKDELERRGEEVEMTRKEKQEAYENLRDEQIEKAAGDDEEYKETLRKHYDRIGEETLSIDEVQESLSEAHVLALNEMDRDITAFNPGEVVSKGEAPDGKQEGDDEGDEEVDQLVDYASQVSGMESGNDEGDNVDEMLKNDEANNEQ